MKLRSIQILRGIAAMAVVAHHAFNHAVPVGAAGVDLFFVISGFIMATCAAGRRPGPFLADRAWRIYPLWLIAVAPWLLMSANNLLDVVGSITLWPIYGNRFVPPVLGLGWTLSFELLFYLGFALALATRVTVPLLIFGLCLILGLNTHQILFWFAGSPLTFEFLLGVLIARLPLRQPLGVAAIVLGLVWLALAPTAYYDQSFGVGALYRLFAWGIPAAMLLYGARTLEERLAGRAFDLPVLVGGASYSIYLFHQLVMLRFHGAAGLVLSATAGIAVYLTLERTIMRARPRWGERSVAQPAPMASLRT